jgi:hypothetical protein
MVAMENPIQSPARRFPMPAAAAEVCSPSVLATLREPAEPEEVGPAEPESMVRPEHPTPAVAAAEPINPRLVAAVDQEL